MCFAITGKKIAVSRTFAEIYRGLSQTLPWNTDMSILKEYSVVPSFLSRNTIKLLPPIIYRQWHKKVLTDVAVPGRGCCGSGTPRRTLFVLGFVGWFLIYLETAVLGIPIFRSEGTFQYLRGPSRLLSRGEKLRHPRVARTLTQSLPTHRRHACR